MDVPSTSVIVIPSLIEDAQAVAGFLSEVLQCDEAMLHEKITKHVSTQKLNRKEGISVMSRQEQSSRLQLRVSCWFRISSDTIQRRITLLGTGLYRY